MAQHLLLTVRMHGDGLGIARFHGMSQGTTEWPPAPGRVFQALLAGVARAGAIPPASASALEWLERLPPPLIGAPRRALGQSVSLFVPNNDADSLPDPRDVSGIRSKKIVQPSLFSDDVPFVYAWKLGDGLNEAKALIEAANELYQLGRGIDVAWAFGEVLEDEALESRLAAYRGVLHEADAAGRGDRMLACPVAGSLESLEARHRSVRLRVEGRHTFFVNAPKPRFVSVNYESSRRLVAFELRDRSREAPWPWALGRVVKLVERLRDGAAQRLREGLGGSHEEIERALIGRKADGQDAAPPENRVRIIPLPSIGSEWADHAVRRVVLEVSNGAELDARDVEWAFSGLEWPDVAMRVVRADDNGMLDRYLGPSRCWRSVTAVALPESAMRRRIEPSRRGEEAKNATERIAEEARAVAAVHGALRHAGVRGTATRVRVQREPFESRGARAEAFAADTRFAKERMWHVELELDRAVRGPLVIGDGRFLGLGVMVPQPSVGSARVLAFEVLGDVKDAPHHLASALRRAVMARVQAAIGDRALGRYFSGHEEGGGKAQQEHSNHLAFQWDARRRRLLVIAPDQLDRRGSTPDDRNFTTLAKALEGFVELRAGAAGRFAVQRASITEADPLIAPSRLWRSATPYTVTRHKKGMSPAEVLEHDVLAECERRGLPRPRVTVREPRGVAGRGLEGILELEFAVAVPGPVVLGRTRYLGGGLFIAP